MSNDWRDPTCRCCECQGKFCMVYHPGHSHRYPMRWEVADELGRDTTDQGTEGGDRDTEVKDSSA